MSAKNHVKNRATARILLIDDKNMIFLLKTHFDPEVGLPPRWLTPGGGIDDGESTLEAAVRELFEETGLIVRPEELGEPVLVTSGRWDWADGENYHTYTDTIFELQVIHFEPDVSGFTTEELRDILEYRWWTIEEVLGSEDLFAPHDLREWLRARYNG